MGGRIERHERGRGWAATSASQSERSPPKRPRPTPPRSERRAAVASRQAGARGGRQRHQPPHPHRAPRGLGHAVAGDRTRPLEALAWIRGRRALRHRHPRHAHAGDGRRGPGAGDPRASRRARRCSWSSSRRSAAARRAPRRRASPRTCTSRSSRLSSSTRWPPSWPTSRSTCAKREARLAPSSTPTMARPSPAADPPGRGQRGQPEAGARGCSARWATAPTWRPTGSRRSTPSSGRRTTWF